MSHLALNPHSSPKLHHPKDIRSSDPKTFYGFSTSGLNPVCKIVFGNLHHLQDSRKANHRTKTFACFLGYQSTAAPVDGHHRCYLVKARADQVGLQLAPEDQIACKSAQILERYDDDGKEQETNQSQ